MRRTLKVLETKRMKIFNDNYTYFQELKQKLLISSQITIAYNWKKYIKHIKTLEYLDQLEK